MSVDSPTSSSSATAKASEILGPLASRNVNIGSMTTFRVGGAASLFVEISNEQQLEILRMAIIESGADVLAIGKGSNMLVADEGFDGIVVVLGMNFMKIGVDQVAEETRSLPSISLVTAGGATSLPVVARKTAANGLRGFEWAVGVPGSVGGAVRMNAGGHGSQMADVVTKAKVFDMGIDGDGKAIWVENSALEFGYRSSAISENQLVLKAQLSLDKGEVAPCEKRISEIVAWRREHQPGGQNCGSVFINPPSRSVGGEEIHAARLIEEAGLKGYRIGTAHVSTKHANFFQADQGGSAADLKALIDHVGSVVSDRFGIELLTEVKMVGF